MKTQLSGGLEPTKYNGRAKDACPSKGIAWRGRRRADSLARVIVLTLALVLCASALAYTQELSEAEKNYSALSHAYRTNDIVEMTRLIEHGADVNYTPFDSVPLIANFIVYHRVHLIRLFVDNGLKVNQDIDFLGTITPLLHPIIQSYTAEPNDSLLQIIELLFQKGEDPDRVAFGKEFPLLSFVTFAYVGGGLKDTRLIELFIRYGANVNQEPPVGSGLDLGITALNVACVSKLRNGLELVKYLISKGANVNRKAAGGPTPLQVALDDKHYKIAEYLITQGADPHLNNETGESPYEKAKKRQYPRAISKLIIEAGK